MGVEPRAGIGESTLYLRGAYELPMQFFGRLLDAALTPHVARRSLENFIDEIAAACEARVNQREAEFARYHFYAQQSSMSELRSRSAASSAVVRPG